MIKLSFVMGAGLSSKTIAWFSAGGFSHVDYILDSGMRLGARSDITGQGMDEVDPGVQIRPANYEEWSKEVQICIPCTNQQKSDYEAFLKLQLGKPYDKTAIWGFAAGRDWREKDSWFCSELQAAALEQGLIIPRLYTEVNKITPACLLTVCSSISNRSIVCVK